MSLDNLLTRLVVAVEKLAGISTVGNGAIITNSDQPMSTSATDTAKPARGRPRKTAEAPPPEPVTEDGGDLSLDGDDTNFLDADPPESEKEVTLEMLRDKLVEVQKLPGCSKWPLEALAQHGAQTLGKLPKDKYSSVYNSAVKKLSGTKAAK